MGFASIIQSSNNRKVNVQLLFHRVHQFCLYYRAKIKLRNIHRHRQIMGQQCSTINIAEGVQQIIEEKHQPQKLSSKFIPQQAIEEILLLRRKNNNLISKYERYRLEGGEQQFFGYLRNGKKQGYGQLKMRKNQQLIKSHQLISPQLEANEKEYDQQYYGYFHHNKPHIKGVLVFSPQHYYIGQFQNGQMNGFGKQVTEDYKFIGDYVNGKKKYGVMTLWHQGSQHQEESNEQKYLGRKVSSDQVTNPQSQHRQAIIEYEGSFSMQSGKFEGYGQMRFPPSNQSGSDNQDQEIPRWGDMYKGEFKEGNFNGFGRYYEGGLIIYEGQFKDNQYHGEGRYSWKDGSYFEGKYQYGSKHGQGKYVASSPSVSMESTQSASSSALKNNNKQQSYTKHNTSNAREMTILGIWQNGNLISRLKPVNQKDPEQEMRPDTHQI